LVDTIIETARTGCGPLMTVSFGGRPASRPGLCVDYEWVSDRFLRMAAADGRRVAVMAMRGKCDLLTETFLRNGRAKPPDRESVHVDTGDPTTFAAGVVPRLVEWRHRGPVAVMTSVDTDAIVLVQELQKRGLSVPQDVAILGYGNLFFARLSSPAISTVDVSGTVPAMADKVIELLEHMETTKTLEEREYAFRPAVIVRESFAPPTGWDAQGLR
jgi:DNA-binding LacI/PurR family transcriptional regulator